jgi:hypothetical protein
MNSDLRARANPLARTVWLCGLAAALVLSSTASAAAGGRHHGTFRYHERISGGAAPSSFDYNQDGLGGHYVVFAGSSNLGPVHGVMMVEYDLPNAGPDAACPDAMLRVPIVVSAGNRALTRTGAQLFMHDDADSGLFCLDPTTGAFTMSLEGAFTGGIGRLAGATGTYEYEGSGQVLLQDNFGAGSPFGGFVLETRGEFTLPSR